MCRPKNCLCILKISIFKIILTVRGYQLMVVSLRFSPPRAPTQKPRVKRIRKRLGTRQVVSREKILSLRQGSTAPWTGLAWKCCSIRHYGDPALHSHSIHTLRFIIMTQNSARAVACMVIVKQTLFYWTDYETYRKPNILI